MAPRVVLHADMDAFYAAIEQRDDPRLRGRPVMVGGDGRRGVVAAASYEARRFGVRSAMPGAVARRLCPHGVFVPPRMDVYAAVSRQVFEVFARFTPLVEPLSLDEAFLDVTGSQALFGSGADIAHKVKDEVRAATALTVSVGVAASKFVAKVASDLRKPDGLVVVPPGSEPAFLAPLPLRALWGAGPKTVERLAALGLTTVADVQALSHEQAIALLGASLGEHFWCLSRGIDPRHVEPDRQAKSIGHEVTFADDLTTRDACSRVLLELAEGVGRRLRAAGLRGHVVKLKLRFSDFTTLHRQARLVTPTHDDLEIHGRALQLFDAAWPAVQPVRLLGVSVADLAAGGEPGQGTLFATPRRKSDQVLRAFDAIRERFGDDAIRHGGT